MTLPFFLQHVILVYVHMNLFIYPSILLYIYICIYVVLSLSSLLWFLFFLFCGCVGVEGGGMKTERGRRLVRWLEIDTEMQMVAV